MTTEDIIIQIFCLVDDQMREVTKHAQAKLYPSEVVTIRILFALKGGYFRAFYRWLHRDYAALFGVLPDRTRLQRLLTTHHLWNERLLAEPSLLTVIDSYPIELRFPIRQGPTSGQVGKKGLDKGRWSVGIKLCSILTPQGRVVAWDWATMNVADQHFHPLIEQLATTSIVLADWGFRSQTGVPSNCKLCKKGTWNERMRIETAWSMLTVVCDLKRVHHRVVSALTARLASVMAMCNVLLTLFHLIHPDADPVHISIAEFSL